MRQTRVFFIIVLNLLFLAEAASQNPIASFSIDTSRGCDSLQVQFTDESNNVVNSWYWEFGDGDTSHVQNPTHTYDSAGTFKVVLSVNGATPENPTPPFGLDTAEAYITVNPSPKTDFTHEVLDSTAYYRLYFQDISTNLAQGVDYTFDFSFGDGESSQGSSRGYNYPHLYDNPGNYNVKLVVRDEIGCADSTTQTVSVNNIYEENNPDPAKDLPVSIPNIFTPDGDPFNDLFKVKSTGNSDLKLRLVIYSRTGFVIYEKEGTTHVWDGKTPAGLDAPEGAYYYVLSPVNNSGYKAEKGFFYLYR